jgi:alcohol dehydrogenase
MKQFYLPTKIITGLGCLSQLPSLIRALGQRALLVSGRSALHRSGLLQRTLDQLQAAGVQTVLYDAVPQEPTLDVVQSALDTAREEQADVIIGMGGGSAIDVGKAAAALCNKALPIIEYHRGRPVTEPGLPFVSVPTTAGTGSEVTNNAVLTDTEHAVKQSIRGPYLFAVAAVVDPESTISLPLEITASSGADALCQAIESFAAVDAQPATDALAGQAIQRIGRSLVRAYEQGSDISARADMLYGSLMAGMAMTNTRLGGAHALAHPLGSRYHIAHGVICGLLLPYVMDYSLEYAPQKYAVVAELLGADTQGLSPDRAAREAVIAVRKMLERIGIPDRLRLFGVGEEDLTAIAAESAESANAKNNSRPLQAPDLEAILRQAL